MFGTHKLLQHACFWSVLILAATAEGWMDLLCRVLYHV